MFVSRNEWHPLQVLMENFCRASGFTPDTSQPPRSFVTDPLRNDWPAKVSGTVWRSAMMAASLALM